MILIDLSSIIHECLKMERLAVALQAFVCASIFFVWVVRYQNIISEFKHFKYPDWLRDLVGILKLTFSILLMIGVTQKSFALAGGVGISFLMMAALMTHLRVKNPFQMMLPSLTLMILSMVISFLNYRMLAG